MTTYIDARRDTDPEGQKLLDEETATRVIDTVKRLVNKNIGLRVGVHSKWCGGQRWARNRASLTSDRRNVGVVVTLQKSGRNVQGAGTNQIDPESLRGLCEYVNYYYDLNVRADPMLLLLDDPSQEAKGLDIWDNAAADRTAPENGEAVAVMTERAEAQGFLSAGFIETLCERVVYYTRDDSGRETLQKGHLTAVQCSATVRHPKGTGSGWAGSSSFDLARVDMKKIGEAAFDKCLKSINPVRIEPGRYQTILEPQAVATFAVKFVALLNRKDAETKPETPFWFMYDQGLSRGRSKLGLRIMDRRLNISHDPEDPVSGTHLQEGVRRIQIVTEGVLTGMFEETQDMLGEADRNQVGAFRNSFVMAGTQTTSMDEMISTTKRGLLVTRVSLPEMLDGSSMLLTGVTRDGLWLIENGKITKAVRNFRWTESPLFIFNNVESVGEAIPVFMPNESWFSFMPGAFQLSSETVVVPPLKINDFSFTSTIDAI